MHDDENKPSPWDDFKPIGDLRGDHRPPSRWERFWGSLLTLIIMIVIGVTGALYYLGGLVYDLESGTRPRINRIVFLLVLVVGVSCGISEWFETTSEERRTRRPPKG